MPIGVDFLVDSDVFKEEVPEVDDVEQQILYWQTKKLAREEPHKLQENREAAKLELLLQQKKKEAEDEATILTNQRRGEQALANLRAKRAQKKQMSEAKEKSAAEQQQELASRRLACPS